MAKILKKQNDTIKTQNQLNSNIDTNMELNFLNEALCKMSKSVFFDHQISYCLNSDVDKNVKEK